MADLVAIKYDDMYKAQEVRLTLVKLQQEYLIDLEDAVVAVKDEDGKVKLHQAMNMTAAGAAGGGFWGTLVGVLFFGPFFGIGTLAGAAAGAVSGALSDVGINDDFMKQLGEQFTPRNLGALYSRAKGDPGQSPCRDQDVRRHGSSHIAVPRARRETAGGAG